MGNSRFEALVLITIVGLAVVGWQAALVDGATASAVANEPIVVDYGDESSVSESGVQYNETVTIRYNGVTLEEGESYEWDHHNGTVEWLESPATEDGGEANINYTVYQQNERTSGIAQLYGPLPFVGALLLAVVLVFGMLSSVADTWGS